MTALASFVIHTSCSWLFCYQFPNYLSTDKPIASAAHKLLRQWLRGQEVTKDKELVALLRPAFESPDVDLTQDFREGKVQVDSYHLPLEL